jgi:hypothetical protein
MKDFLKENKFLFSLSKLKKILNPNAIPAKDFKSFYPTTSVSTQNMIFVKQLLY